MSGRKRREIDRAQRRVSFFEFEEHVKREEVGVFVSSSRRRSDDPKSLNLRDIRSDYVYFESIYLFCKFRKMVTSCCLCSKECIPFNPQRSFHRIPTDEQMRNKWFSIIGRTVSYKGARVCSDHFAENDFHEMSLYSRIRRLKSTAIPSVFIKQNRKSKKRQSSTFQEINANAPEFQNDSEIESQNEKDIIYCSTRNCEENNTNNDVESKKSENIEQKSAPVLDATENLVNVSLDLERKINTVSVDNPKNVGDNFVNKNGTTGKRKSPSSNLRNPKIKKIFVHMSKYNIECFRKMDFSSDKKWSAFLRYVAYNRHQNKILAQKNRRLEKKMYILQDMLEELM